LVVSPVVGAVAALGSGVVVVGCGDGSAGGGAAVVVEPFVVELGLLGALVVDDIVGVVAVDVVGAVLVVVGAGVLVVVGADGLVVLVLGAGVLVVVGALVVLGACVLVVVGAVVVVGTAAVTVVVAVVTVVVTGVVADGSGRSALALALNAHQAQTTTRISASRRPRARRWRTCLGLCERGLNCVRRSVSRRAPAHDRREIPVRRLLSRRTSLFSSSTPTCVAS
jgi:hypothetical protein